MYRSFQVVAALCIFALPNISRADDISDAISEASKAYAAGDLGTARSELGEALQFITQRVAVRMGAALPQPLSGWTARDVETTTSQMAFMGGGLQASRTYESAQGKNVQIQITADSPIVAQLAVVLNNPAMAGAMGKLIKLGNQRAIQTSDNEIQAIIDNRILVSFTGSASIDDKIAYARALDIGAISKVN